MILTLIHRDKCSSHPSSSKKLVLQQIKNHYKHPQLLKMPGIHEMPDFFPSPSGNITEQGVKRLLRNKGPGCHFVHCFLDVTESYTQEISAVGCWNKSYIIGNTYRHVNAGGEIPQGSIHRSKTIGGQKSIFSRDERPWASNPKWSALSVCIYRQNWIVLVGSKHMCACMHM